MFEETSVTTSSVSTMFTLTFEAKVLGLSAYAPNVDIPILKTHYVYGKWKLKGLILWRFLC
jgi:hypothetical protein